MSDQIIKSGHVSFILGKTPVAEHCQADSEGRFGKFACADMIGRRGIVEVDPGLCSAVLTERDS